jgi:hypothetical protein
MFDNIFGSDLKSLLSETYDLVNKYKTLKTKLAGKLGDYRKTIAEKLEKHTAEVNRIKADYEAKLVKETEAYSSVTAVSIVDVKAIEDAIAHIDKFLKAFDELD